MPHYYGMPICEHIAAGAQLQDARDLIMNVTRAVAAGYPKSSPAGHALHDALRKLDQARSLLDGYSANENPGDQDWDSRVYYGQDREVREPIVEAILDRHLAFNPSCGCIAQ